MNPIRHGMKEAYKQLGRNTFCCMFLTLAYEILAGAFAFTDIGIGGFSVSGIFMWLGVATGVFSVLSYIAHYIFLFTVHIQNTETQQLLKLKHSSRHLELAGWRLHRTDGPAVKGFDIHQEEDFELYYFEGKSFKKEEYLKILNATSKGSLNEFLSAPEEHLRNFAKHKMRSL